MLYCSIKTTLIIVVEVSRGRKRKKDLPGSIASEKKPRVHGPRETRTPVLRPEPGKSVLSVLANLLF